jgi:hypothetical protein
VRAYVDQHPRKGAAVRHQMLRLSCVAVLLMVPAWLNAQFTLSVSVPGKPVKLTSCEAADSALGLIAHERKGALYRAEDTATAGVLLSSEPFTPKKFQGPGDYYLWGSAEADPTRGGTTATAVLHLWAFGGPKYPQGPQLSAAELVLILEGTDTIRIRKGSVESSAGHIDLGGMRVHGADAREVAYVVPLDLFATIARGRKAMARLGEGTFEVSEAQRAGLANVYVGAVCGTPASQ